MTEWKYDGEDVARFPTGDDSAMLVELRPRHYERVEHLSRTLATHMAAHNTASRPMLFDFAMTQVVRDTFHSPYRRFEPTDDLATWALLATVRDDPRHWMAYAHVFDKRLYATNAYAMRVQDTELDDGLYEVNRDAKGGVQYSRLTGKWKRTFANGSQSAKELDADELHELASGVRRMVDADALAGHTFTPDSPLGLGFQYSRFGGGQPLDHYAWIETPKGRVHYALGYMMMACPNGLPTAWPLHTMALDPVEDYMGTLAVRYGTTVSLVMPSRV